MLFVRRHKYLVALGVLILILAGTYGRFFGPAGTGGTNTFVVEPSESLGSLAERLKQEGVIRSVWAFELAYIKENGPLVRAGGYQISSQMDAWTVAATLGDSPYLTFVKIPRGRRKEETVAILANMLSWTAEQKQEFLSASDAWPEAYAEGVFFPDTYLIPSDATPRMVAEEMRAHFMAAYVPLSEEAAKQNIKWTTVVRMASLIEREAAGPHDMPVIAGIMWNRLERDMKLQIDASLQYVKGNEEDGWWGRVKSEDKYLESEFNTYQNKGLPPPISNPGIDSMTAVLFPEKTNCLYYLHDYDGEIHCSPNYAGHVANIRKYLQ